MPPKTPLSEDLIVEHERLAREGVSIVDACREVGPSSRTYYEWGKLGEAGENGLHQEFYERVYMYRRKGAPGIPIPGNDWRRIDYFEEWSHGLILDSGDPWKPEPWQLAIVEDIISGDFQAVWSVVPEGCGKTTLTAGVILFLLEHQLTPEIPIGSATTTQAETLFRQIEGFIVRSDKLKDFNLAPGVRRIDCRRTHGHTRVYPHNERSGDGVIPSAACLDEAHLHPDLRLYRVWKGKHRKRQGVVMLISTGGEPSTEFEELRSKILKEAEHVTQEGPYIRAVYQGTVLHDWAVRDREQATDMEVVAAANPLASITAAELAQKYAEPEMTEEHWLRRTCNIPARAEGTAIKPEDWDALEESGVKPRKDTWTIGWIDLGWQIDTTAIGLLAWEADERRLIFDVKVLEPPVSESDIVIGIVERQHKWNPVGWVYDPNAGGQQMVQLLDSGRHPDQDGTEFNFFEHTQDNAPMCLAATRFDEAIRSKWLRHDGDRVLRAHILNGVKKSVGFEKWRYDRPADAKGERRKKYPNDALIGAVMGHSVAVSEHDKPKHSRAVF